MVQQLLNHIERHNLCKTTDKILLAVSGGVDSMVMLDLFRKAGFVIGVVHCNFQLRGDDSDTDELFVKQSCAESIPFYSKKFDTSSFAEVHELSIQMAARALRYEFFEQIINENSFSYVATAHQLNDSIETTLLNFVKGTGIGGMTGIPVKNNRVIRPMLFATRQQIEAYAKENNINWREDSSNSSDDYQRNFLRHKIIPGLKEINPNLEDTFRNTQERLRGAAEFTKKFADDFFESPNRKDGNLSINKDKLKQTESPAVVLWEILKEFDFNFDQCKAIVEVHQSGKVFNSGSHSLTVDRDSYIVQPRQNMNFSEMEIQKDHRVVKNFDQSLFIQLIKNEDFSLSRSHNIAQVDAEKIQFPLKWRHWKPGDFFMPLGMQQNKKLSDFFIDLKIPLPEKERITVVESNGTIVWVVGFRIHDSFKVISETKLILMLECKETRT